MGTLIIFFTAPQYPSNPLTTGSFLHPHSVSLSLQWHPSACSTFLASPLNRLSLSLSQALCFTKSQNCRDWKDFWMSPVWPTLPKQSQEEVAQGLLKLIRIWVTPQPLWPACVQPRSKTPLLIFKRNLPCNSFLQWPQYIPQYGHL